MLKGFQTRFPAMLAEGKVIGAEVNFGDFMNDKKITFKITIAIYSYI